MTQLLPRLREAKSRSVQDTPGDIQVIHFNFTALRRSGSGIDRVGRRCAVQDSSKGGAVETGCSDFYGVVH